MSLYFCRRGSHPVTGIATVLQENGADGTTIEEGMTMATGNGIERVGLAQAVLLDDPDFLRGIVERTLLPRRRAAATRPPTVARFVEIP